MAAYLARNPALIVVAGLGAQGAALGTRHGLELFPAVDMEAPVVDTNGAGDALAVGFLTSYVLHGYSLPDALLCGQIAARHTCTLRASSSDLITRSLLDATYNHIRRQHRPAY
jgi:sugar/nucleoside kinase (ribokinase family)